MVILSQDYHPHFRPQTSVVVLDQISHLHLMRCCILHLMKQLITLSPRQSTCRFRLMSIRTLSHILWTVMCVCVCGQFGLGVCPDAGVGHKLGVIEFLPLTLLQLHCLYQNESQLCTFLIQTEVDVDQSYICSRYSAIYVVIRSSSINIYIIHIK